MKRLLTFLLLPALLLLGGCSLARADAGEPAGSDRLVGFLVTQESLDLFDAEAYFEDHGDLPDGLVDSDAGQGRLYAELETFSFSDSTGTVHESARYVFPCESVAYAYVAVYDIDAPDYDRTGSSGNCETLDFKNIETENGREVSVHGTARVTPEIFLQGDIFQMNPVYQSPGGSIYACEGSSISSDFSGTGEQFTITKTDTETITLNGKTEQYDAEVSFTLKLEYAPEEIVVRQVGADNVPLTKDAYQPGALPESLTLESGTEYLVVETCWPDGNGNAAVTRELVEPNMSSFSTDYARDGFFQKQHTTLIWP